MCWLLLLCFWLQLKSLTRTDRGITYYTGVWPTIKASSAEWGEWFKGEGVSPENFQWNEDEIMALAFKKCVNDIKIALQFKFTNTPRLDCGWLFNCLRLKGSSVCTPLSIRVCRPSGHGTCRSLTVLLRGRQAEHQCTDPVPGTRVDILVLTTSIINTLDIYIMVTMG